MNIQEMLNLKKTVGDIGLEIEVEGLDLPNIANMAGTNFLDNWTVTQDGSLRGEAWEYVFPKPKSLMDTSTSLDMLEAAYQRCGSKIYDSIRAGIHVHINVQSLTYIQLMNMLVIYYCLEDVLVNFCGKDRVGNHFCLRARDAEYIVYTLFNTLTDPKCGAMELTTDNIRYASMNLASLFKYGSVEFRALRSTRDSRRILTWASALLYIREAAKNFKDPKEIIESLSMQGANNFLPRILGEKLAKVFSYPKMEEDILYCSRIIQGLVFRTNWGADLYFNKDLYSVSNRSEIHSSYKISKNRNKAEQLEAPIIDGVEEQPKIRYVDEWDNDPDFDEGLVEDQEPELEEDE